MLTIHDSDRRLGRRSFLRIGSLGLGGLALPQLLATQAAAAGQGRSVTDKSVIFLFLHGGPSQIETFDPKMDAPAEVRSATGELSTSLPGITFGGTFPHLSKLAHRMSIVRSYQTGDGNHDIKPIVSRHTLGANLGSLYSRVAGTNHPATGMPTNAMLFPRAVDSSTQPGNFGFGRFDAVGPLGSGCTPFIPGAGGDLQKDMELVLKRDQLDDRRNLLTRLDQLKRSLDSRGAVEGMDRFQEQAFQTIVGGVSKAFDLSLEDPKTLARYDTAPLVRPDQISRKWNNYNNYVDNAKSLGKLLLLARRLCEGGCGFVTVTTNFVWDMHADVNNATAEEGMQYMGPPLDHAVSAFMEDIEARGLSDKILLVVSGEMGRTPRLNNNGGRDHWGGLAPLALIGGGLKMGQVICQSTRDAGQPLSEPLGIDNLIATIMGTLLRLGEVRLQTNIPTEVVRTLTTPQPIPGLL
ncbi:MAG: DUF1501 domain-containing protein [Planctomycetota bacterium]